MARSTGWRLAAAGSTLVLALSSCAADSGDPTDHARVSECGEQPMTNDMKVVVENRGSGAADYEVLVAQVGQNGSQVTTRVARFLAVQPGQTASDTVFGEHPFNPWTCEIVDVERTPR